MKHIILIEDNEGDALLIEEALATSGLICEVTRFRDGSDAISALLEGHWCKLQLAVKSVRVPSGVE